MVEKRYRSPYHLIKIKKIMNKMNIKNVAVIGGGTMGNGIAHVFAMSGFSVTLIETNQDFADRAVATITKNLDRMVSKEKITQDKKEESQRKKFI